MSASFSGCLNHCDELNLSDQQLKLWPLYDFLRIEYELNHELEYDLIKKKILKAWYFYHYSGVRQSHVRDYIPCYCRYDLIYFQHYANYSNLLKRDYYNLVNNLYHLAVADTLAIISLMDELDGDLHYHFLMIQKVLDQYHDIDCFDN